MKKFLIISQRRTGSNFLVSLLNSHPNISCYGEVFRKEFNLEKHIPDLEAPFYDRDYRLENSKELFEQIERIQDKKTLAWGFKLMPHHLGDRITEILDYGFDCCFILKRSNKLAQYSSELIALETGQGVAGKFATIKTAKVKFFSKGFQRFCENVSCGYSVAEQALQSTNISSIQVDYIDLSKLSTHQIIQKKLDVPEEKLKSGQKKRNDSVIINRFSNVEFVRKYLLATGQNHLMLE